MANSIVTIKVMPESPEVDMEKVKEEAIKVLTANGAKGDVASKIEPVAFGIKHLYLSAMFDGDDNIEYEEVADKITAEVDGVTESVLEKIDLAMG